MLRYDDDDIAVDDDDDAWGWRMWMRSTLERGAELRRDMEEGRGVYYR